MTYEELLMLRLTYEVALGTRDQHLVEYLDHLQEITPDFETYKRIWLRLADRKN